MQCTVPTAELTFRIDQDIISLNEHGLGLNLQNGPRSYVNIPNERPYTTFYVFPIAMFTIYITVSEILAVEMCMILTLTFRMVKGQM